MAGIYTEETRKEFSKGVYDMIVNILEERKWRYEKFDDQLSVDFMITGKDLMMHFIIVVDEERRLVRLMSPFTFRPSKDNSLNLCVATTVINHAMGTGCFTYDPIKNQLMYKIATSVIHGDFGAGLFDFLIDFACEMVDAFNDKLFAVSLGYLGLDDIMSRDFLSALS